MYDAHRSLAGVALAVLLAMTLAACATTPPASPGAGAAPAAKPAKPAGGPAAKPGASGTDFAGKTVTLSVNFSAGGPTDVFGRMIAQHLDKHIPGRPQVIVENRPGAGGVIGLNHVYNVARKDGLTVGVFSAPFGPQLLGAEGVQYDAAQFTWLAGAVETAVGFTHQSLGVKTPAELLTTTNEIVVGGLSPDSTKDQSQRTFLNAIGAKYRYVTGYPGSADARLALIRGEINFFEDSVTSWAANYVPMVREGSAFPMGQQGIVRGGQIVPDPRVGDIPTYSDVMVQLKGEGIKQSLDYRAHQAVAQMASMLRVIVYPPGTSPETAAAMRQAFADTFADPEFQAAAEKQLGFQFEFVPGAEAQAHAEKVIREVGADTEVVEHLKRLSAGL